MSKELELFNKWFGIELDSYYKTEFLETGVDTDIHFGITPKYPLKKDDLLKFILHPDFCMYTLGIFTFVVPSHYKEDYEQYVREWKANKEKEEV